MKNRLLDGEAVMEPVARQKLQETAGHGQTRLLSLDQTDLGDRRAGLMVSLRVGDRSLPLAWIAEEGAANMRFEGQRIVLERGRGWLPAGAEVLGLADRFYPSVALFEWLQHNGWPDRLRLKGKLWADPGAGDETTTGELARGGHKRYLPGCSCLPKGGDEPGYFA